MTYSPPTIPRTNILLAKWTTNKPTIYVVQHGGNINRKVTQTSKNSSPKMENIFISSVWTRSVYQSRSGNLTGTIICVIYVICSSHLNKSYLFFLLQPQTATVINIAWFIYCIILQSKIQICFAAEWWIMVSSLLCTVFCDNATASTVYCYMHAHMQETDTCRCIHNSHTHL